MFSTHGLLQLPCRSPFLLGCASLLCIALGMVLACLLFMPACLPDVVAINPRRPTAVFEKLYCCSPLGKCWASTTAFVARTCSSRAALLTNPPWWTAGAASDKFDTVLPPEPLRPSGRSVALLLHVRLYTGIVSASGPSLLLVSLGLLHLPYPLATLVSSGQ